MSEPRCVHDLGGSSAMLEILAARPVRGLRNWPAMRKLVLAGHVSSVPVPEPGQDPGEEHWWVYSITDRGRRKRASYRGRFA